MTNIASIWDVVRCELLRLETQGKDDHRDSWMGNAIKAVNRLEEHCTKYGAYADAPEGDARWDEALEAAAALCELNDEGSDGYGNRVLMPKTSTNINGFGYAKGIRALKCTPPQRGPDLDAMASDPRN